MNNKELMNINENSIFYKIKLFFVNIKSKLFGAARKQEIETTIDKDINKSIEGNNKTKFYEEIKVQDIEKINNIQEKKNFIKDLNGNIEALNLLSIERLEKLVEYNQNIIERNAEEIKRLKMES